MTREHSVFCTCKPLKPCEPCLMTWAAAKGRACMKHLVFLKKGEKCLKCLGLPGYEAQYDNKRESDAMELAAMMFASLTPSKY